MSILSEIRRVKLTTPGIKAIEVEDSTYNSILFALRNIQRVNSDGPQRVHKLFVDDIEIKKELTQKNWRCMNDTIINALKAAYRKHVLDDDSIGWDELGRMLCDALCEAIGDQGYQDWREELTQKREG